MTGHVKLGAVGALRDYYLKEQGDGVAWSRGPANPFAATVNTSNQYDRADDWNEWSQEDWQTGVARVDPEEGGFLYAEAETRVPKQVILPPLVQQCDTRTIASVKADSRYMPLNVAGTITVGAGSYTRVAMAFTTVSEVFAAMVYFYARIPAGTSATMQIRADSAGSPGSVVANMYNSEPVDADNPDRNFYWCGGLASGTLSAATTYWLCIEPESALNTIEVAYGTSGFDTLAKAYNGSSWANITGTYLLYTTGIHGPSGHNFIRFNSVLYAYNAGGGLYKYDSGNEQFDSVGTITGSGNVTSVAVYGPTLFFARSTGNYTTMNTSEAFSAAATTATLFLEYKGLLYRSYQNDLYYSDDGSTWSAAFPVGGDDSEIRGMAGMGDSLYMATDKALFRFAPGNIVEEVTRFGAEDSSNGAGMMEYQGRLYIPAAGRLFRFDPSGQMMDIWVSREGDLPTSRIGVVASLARMNNWLVAYSVGSSVVGRPSLWIWQEEGWHFLANAPQNQFNTTPSAITYRVYYDRGTSRLWFGTTFIGPFFLDIDDYTLNPYNTTSSLYMPYGWLEQDRFYGGLRLLSKAFYSVTVSGENLSSGVCVKVYWQDEGSTAWELLGTADSDGEELIWPTATRPLGLWVRLGLLLQTNDGDETPRVRAVTVKFLPPVNDRRQDQMTLTLKGTQQGVDGALDSYTTAQQITHLESLIGLDGSNSNFLFLYQDPFGVQFEVTIATYSLSVPILAWENGAQVIKEAEATVVLKQLPDNLYSA